MVIVTVMMMMMVMRMKMMMTIKMMMMTLMMMMTTTTTMMMTLMMMMMMMMMFVIMIIIIMIMMIMMMMMIILELQLQANMLKFQRHLQRHPPQIIFTTPGLEETISSWKRRLATHGLNVGAQERLTKFLYAYYLLVHAKSLAELVYMTESSCEKFALVGLQPNAAKTKIFRICTKKNCGGLWISMAARGICFPMQRASIRGEYMQVI